MKDTEQKIIEVSHLKNHLGDKWVHKDVNFVVEKGQIVAIVGGSGSGKTTILRCILMLMNPSAGKIRVFDTDILHCSYAQADRVRRRWGVMFQSGALFSSLTLLENVEFPLRVFTHLSKDLREEIALLKITQVGLSADDANKYPAELSGGMQKRAAVARAIVLDPELLFLDEPTSGLDPHSANAFDDLVLQLRDDLGITVVMVTHDIDSLWRTSDSVVFLGEGKVLAQDPVEKLVKSENQIIKDYFSGPRGQRREETKQA